MDTGLLTRVIFLYMSKAFDRKQHALYNGCLSNEDSVYRGVPQGSILGPTLFLLHLDDIDNCLRHCKIIKYADDSIQWKLQTDISEVYKWLTDKDLSLNLKKGL